MRCTTAAEIESATRDFFRGNGNVVLSQVRNGTGYAKSARTADMMIFSTWPSRGVYCDGLEIKVSRSDLKSELANPQKADDMAKYCRCWWLAVPDDLLTPDMVVPEPWGVLAVSDKGKASVSRKASPLQPVPMDELLVCSVLRNFAEAHTPNHDIEKKIKEGTELRLKEFKANHSYELERHRKALQEFQDATGVNLMTDRGDPIYDMRGAGEAVKTIMSMRRTPAEKLRELAEGLRSAGSIIEAAMSALDLVEQKEKA